jgi:hydrogenase expression/formation protein HypC
MCLGIPGKILEMHEANGMPMSTVDFSGARKEICLAYVPEAKIGDYVIVHVGFALNVIDEQEALDSLQLMREIDLLSGELGGE